MGTGMIETQNDPPETPKVCRECRARREGICAVLSTTELTQLAGNARRTRHLAGEALAIESGEITGYANVTDGVVKLSRVLRDGRQQLVGLQFAPDLMGRLFRTESPLTAEAASDVELCRMPRTVLEGLVDSSTRLKQHLLDQSLQDLDEARDWMVTLGRKNAAERVASLLLLIASRNASSGIEGTDSATFDLPIGRADMADFLGITIETVSRQISKLRHEGTIVISSHRHVVIPDLAALRSRAG